jgi:Polysaccharide lyase
LRRFLFIAAAAAASAFSAVAQTDPDVVWKGDFEGGASSFTGHCSAGDDQWCKTQMIRPQQIQAFPDPVAQGQTAARIEVKYGDVFNGYSDSRSLLTGPPQLWEDEGSERWYRWQTLWPQDWVGSYPKWDELSNPAARSHGGSIVVWHHDANGSVETGSAPLYIWGDDANIVLCLVNQATSTCREKINLAPLQRSHWHDFVVHAKWSSSASVGFLEIWIDGVNVLPLHFAANKYPGMRNYLIVGLYRNGRIGDPNLRWPDGTPVYGANGEPGVAYLDGFIIGKTQAAVLAERPWATPVADAGVPSLPDAGTDPGVGGIVTPRLPETDAGVAPPPKTGLAAIGYPSGCSSRGSRLGWLALPLLALAALRRRRAFQRRSKLARR